MPFKFRDDPLVQDRATRRFFHSAALYYTSLREQHVYKRAARLYYAAFKLDPGKSGRTLAAWLRRAAPMEVDAASVGGERPPKRAKKPRAEAARAALSVA